MSDHIRILGIGPKVNSKDPLDLVTNAKLFYDDATLLKERGTAGQFVMYIHAIELSLKSFLTIEGLTKAELLKIGHDLSMLYSCAVDKGFQALSEDQKVVLDELNEGNKKAAIRYEFDFAMPSLQNTHALTDLILKTATAHEKDFNRAESNGDSK
jgi:hypothetical protein